MEAADDANYVEPVKKSLCIEIFNTDFNIAFLEPKSDRCDTPCDFCTRENTQHDTEVHNIHLARKTATKEERDRDRRFSCCCSV